MSKPLCVDLFCGLGGWTDGFLAEGWNVIGFDITRHEYPSRNMVCGPDEHLKGMSGVNQNGSTLMNYANERRLGPLTGGTDRYPAQLVLQDVLTIHGSQFRNADIIVASPPCQQYSWLAMPWSRSKNPNNSKAAKALRAKWEAEGPDNRLFDACFRIQREAIEATRIPCYQCSGTGRGGEWPFGRCVECQGEGYGPARFIPLIVENVRGAQEWVGLSGPAEGISQEERWRRGRSAWNYGSFHLWGDVPALMPVAWKVPPKRAMDDLKNGVRKLLHEHLPVGTGPMGRNAPEEGQKTVAHVNKRDGHSHTRHLTNQAESDAVKIGGDWFSDPNSTCLKHGSKSSARKAASAMIAKIPLPLSTHIARVYRP